MSVNYGEPAILHESSVNVKDLTYKHYSDFAKMPKKKKKKVFFFSFFKWTIALIFRISVQFSSVP